MPKLTYCIFTIHGFSIIFVITIYQLFYVLNLKQYMVKVDPTVAVFICKHQVCRWSIWYIKNCESVVHNKQPICMSNTWNATIKLWWCTVYTCCAFAHITKENYIFLFVLCSRTRQEVAYVRQMVLSTHIDDIFHNIYVNFITELYAARCIELFPDL